MGNMGIWQLLIVVVIIVLLFGTKKLRNLGTDLGSAIKGFKSAVTDETAKKEEASEEDSANSDNLADKSVEKSKTAEKEHDQV
tara:strand:- start:512 stop:760 length:249 start_codon:yes stop_codon:yes gene_type:complete